MNIASEYIKYLFKAQGRHGIHSPFVYDFVDKCLTIKLDENFISARKSLQKSLISNHELIQTEDAGAGSRTLGRIRSVQSIYKKACCKGVYADLLYQLAHHYQPKTILELGTSLGIGTMHLAAGYRDAQVISVDACKDTLKEAKKNLAFMGLMYADPERKSQVQLIHTKFEEYLSAADPKPCFDLVYIDGHHLGRPLVKYLKLLKSCTHENTIFLLDDIRWNDDMQLYWKKLVGSKRYHLSLDLFRMGILIPRPQQQKEHFLIRLKHVLGGF